MSTHTQLKKIDDDEIDDGPLCSKLHKVWCVPCLIPCNFLFFPCRNAVSGKKRRYIKDGFDLDLTYITPNIIVHGFPAHGLEHIYRNPRYEIRKFLETKHKNHYRMYNFCCEPGRGYDKKIFNNNVKRFPFKDHHTPSLEMMVEYGRDLKEWLDADEKNVINLHCKAGKGRAGLMCCVALLRSGVVNSAKEAMKLYDSKRVTNNRGLTVTSQKKFVLFYEAIWRKCWGVTENLKNISAKEEALKYSCPVQPEVHITYIELINLPIGLVYSYSISLWKVTNSGPELLFKSDYKRNRLVRAACSVHLSGNFKITVDFKTSMFSKKLKLIELQHNTFFMDCGSPQVDFGVDQLDIKRKLKEKLGRKILLKLKLQKVNESKSLIDNKTLFLLSSDSDLSSEKNSSHSMNQNISLSRTNSRSNSNFYNEIIEKDSSHGTNSGLSSANSSSHGNGGSLSRSNSYRKLTRTNSRELSHLNHTHSHPHGKPKSQSKPRSSSPITRIASSKQTMHGENRGDYSPSPSQSPSAKLRKNINK